MKELVFAHLPFCHLLAMCLLQFRDLLTIFLLPFFHIPAMSRFGSCVVFSNGVGSNFPLSFGGSKTLSRILLLLQLPRRDKMVKKIQIGRKARSATFGFGGTASGGG